MPSRARVAVLGDVLPALLEGRGTAPGRLEIVASADSQQTLLRSLGKKPVDIIVLECPNVRRETRVLIHELLQAVPASGIILVYGFGAREHLVALRQSNVATMRAPIDFEALEQIALGLLQGAGTAGADQRIDAGALPDSDISPPRLSKGAVARIALSAPRMRCECPHHLADIVLSLRAFEEYSAECENRHVEDAELHHFLWASAARARALFEEAIIRVAEVEGIPLEE